MRSRGFWRMTWVLALGLLLVLGCAAKQPAAPSSAGPKYGGRLKVAMGTSIPIFDSAYASGMANLGIIDLVSETLTKINSDTGEVMPYLAESWTAEGNVWTIKLRKGVKFTDGTPFDAAAVKFNIERMLDPATKALTRSTWTMIKSVDVVDPHTVRITTHEPFGPLMAQLSYAPMGMNSPTQVQKLGNENYHTAPVGTGPFKYVEHIKGDHTLLSRNDEYWGGKPYLDEVYVKPIPEAGARVMALESGEVDVVFNVPPRDVPRLEQNPKIRVIQPPAQRTMHVGINVTRGPLKDKRVRQALNYAVDKQAIVDNIFLGKTYVSDAPVAKNVFGYHSTRVYNYDPEKAKALLKEAGYPNGFSVTLTYSPGRFLMTEEVVQAIQNDLAKVGVKVTLQPLEWASFQAALKKPPEESPELFFIGWGAPTLDADLSLNGFTTDSFPPGMNSMYYSNKEVDDLLLKGRQTVDKAGRLEAYRRAQEIIMEDCPWIFLYVEPQFHAALADVKDLEISVTEMIFCNKTWLDR